MMIMKIMSTEIGDGNDILYIYRIIYNREKKKKKKMCKNLNWKFVRKLTISLIMIGIL